MKHEEFSFLQNCKYAYGLCLRLAPFYAQFSQNYNFDNTTHHSACLEILLENIDKEEELSIISETYTPLLEPMVPDMDDFNSELLASLGLDAITSTLTLLDYIKEKNINTISELNEISLNTAEFIADSMDEFLEIRPKYNRDPLSSENSFREALLNLAEQNVDQNSYQRNLKKLISEHAY